MSISGIAHQGSSTLNYNTTAGINNGSNNNEKSKKSKNANKSLSTAWRGSGKRNIQLENLMKQKEQLDERKQNLMEKGLENGEDASSIQQKIKEIDKQIAEVDKQINKLQTEEKKKTMGTDDKSKEAKKSAQAKNAKETKPEAEIVGTENLNKLLSASKSLSKVRELSKEKKVELGQKRVLDIEIKTDIGRGLNPVGKENRVANIEDNVGNIDEKIADSYKDVHKATENTKKSSAAKDSPKTVQDGNVKDSESASTADSNSVDKQQIQENVKAYTDNMKATEENKNGIKVDVMA